MLIVPRSMRAVICCGLVTSGLGLACLAMALTFADAAFVRPFAFETAHMFRLETSEVDGRARPLRLGEFAGVERACLPVAMLAAYGDWSRTLRHENRVEQATVTYVTPGFETVLGLGLAKGRWLTTAEHVEGSAVVASYGWWRAHGSPTVPGARISIDGHPADVVGVLDPRYQGLLFGQQIAFLVPLHALRRHGAFEVLDYLDSGVAGKVPYHWLRVVGRLRQDAGRRDVANLARRALTESSTATGSAAGAVVTAHGLAQGAIGADSRSAVRRVLGAALATGCGLVVLACLSFGSLLFSALSEHRRSLAVRLALGASETQLARQMIREIVLLYALSLVIAGGLVAVVSPWLSLSAAGAGIHVDVLARFPRMWVVAVVSLFAATASGVSCFAALRIVGRLKIEDLRIDRRSSKSESLRVAAQVVIASALTYCLVAFLVSAVRGVLVDPGFDTRASELVTASLVPAQDAEGSLDGWRSRVRLLESNLSLLPDVVAVSTGPPPLFAGDVRSVVGTGAGSIRLSKPAALFYVGPDFMNVLRPRLLTGRTIGDGDAPSNQPVAVITASLARELFPHGRALGERLGIQVARPGRESGEAHVVGVVDDVRLADQADREGFGIFLALAQFPDLPPSTMWIRVRPGARIEAKIVAATSDAIPGSPPPLVERLDVSIARLLAPTRVALRGAAAFAAAAIAAAMLGLLALIAAATRRHRRDLAIRQALGAPPLRLATLLSRAAAWPLALGLGVGCAVSVAGLRQMEFLLFDTRPLDGIVCAVTVVLTLGATLAAAVPEILRALRVPAAATLRSE